jgi:PKD repeat protein
VKNNAISCPGNAVPVIIEDADISDDDWNNNDYYSPYNYVGNYDGVLYDDLADWIAVTGFDDASKDVNPCFISDTDLSVNHIQLYNTAVVIPGAQFDIDNTDRVGQPDMGAREMVPCTPDAGINEMVSPSNPVSIGVSPIVVNLQNQSLVSLTSAEIHWTVNGVEQVPFSWSGSLNMYEEEDVVIGNYNFQQPLNDLTFWTESPNAGVECNNYNDSVTANRATALCGVYTVGGTNPDFTTLEEAIEGINVAGISCPVEIRMRDGVYNENISLQPVIGASEINTITITSDSQDSSAVLINPLSNMFDYTIRVNGASHFRFDKIGFENGNEDFYINGNVENVHITNCYFGENSGHIHIKDANTENIEIRENYFTDLAIINGEEGSNDVKIVSNILAAFEPGTIQFEGSRISIDSNYIEIGIIQLQTKWDPEVDDDCYIRGNTLNANFNNVGVYAFGKAIREISRNQLRNIEENTAIHLEYMNNTMIVNNFIHSYGVNMATGIFSFSATNSKIVFNSINNESLDLSSACLNIRGSDDVTVKNNIFASPEGGVPVNIVESSMAAYDWDYNDYASPSSYIGNYGGTLYTSLPAWGAAISGDANSKTLDPYYAGSTELRPYQRELNGAGIPVAGVLLDIDGEVRNNVAPDMGADEFMIDMGITDLLGPTLECTHTVSDSVIILLRQFGDVPFVDLHIAYQVNDEPIVEDVIPGTIYNDMEYTFSVPVDMSEPGDYVFKAWLVDTWDDNMNNDTLVETRYTRAEPEADFFWDNPCHDRTVDFTSGSTVAAPYTIDQYFWTFEGAEALGTQTESYTFPGPGSYDVNLRVYTDGNCFDDTTKTFVIDAIPPTAGEISGADSVCQGDLINYSIEELDLADNYFWSLDPVNAGVITPSGRSLDVEWDIDFSGNAVISVYGSNVNGDGCENQLDVLVFDDPVASVVNSDDNCGNATFSIQNTSASNYTSILWSTLGDGIFNDDQILNPDYTPGANDITAGEVKLVFAAQNNDICMKTDTDTLTLTIIDAPQVFAGNDTTIMEGQSLNIAHASASSYNTMSWLSDGDGVFSSNSNLNTIYTPGANDIANGSVSLNLSVSSIAPCTGDVQDGLILTVLPATSAFAGADASICENTPYLIGDATATTFDAVLWSTSGDGSFDDASLVNPEYTPGANDIVNGSVILTMTVSSSFGPDETDQMQINLIRNPELTGIVDTTILDSEQLSLTYVNVTDQAMITWSTSGDGNFNNPTASHPIYTPGILDLQNGSVELTVDVLAQNPCAGDINQTFTLGFIPEPFAFAGEDKIICETSAVTLDDASATDFTSIQWSTSGDGSFSNPNSINPSYLPGTTDIVNGSVTLSLSVTNDIHPPVVDEVIVTINKESIVILDPARTICSGEAVNLNDATAANYSMLVWSSTGDGTFSDISAINPIYIPGFNDILNGNATLTLTAHNDPCTPVAQSTLLTIFSPASVIAGGDQSMCENGIFVNNLASAQYFDEVLWTTDGDGFFPDPTALSAQYVPGANDIANGTVELTATVTSLAPCNGTATDHMTLTIVPSPTVDAGNNLAACEGEAVDVNGASVQDATEFFWTSSGSGSLIGELSLEPTYIPSAEDAAIGLVTLTLHAISEPCDHATDQVQVSVTPMPIAYAGPDTAINPGDSYHVTPAIAANYSYYLWTSTGTGSFDDPTSVNPIYTPSPMDTVNKVVYLTLTTEGLNSCPDVSDMMRLVINANGNVDFTVEHACSQTDVQFYADTVVIDTAKVIDYHWDFGDGTFSDERDPIHVYPVPENYIVTLTITDTLFNEYSETKTIEVDPLPYAFFSYDQPPCGNQFTIFHDESTADNDYITSWHFDFGDGSDTLIIFPDRPESVPHVYTLDMMYDVTLTIETSQGCTDTYTQTLDVQPAPIAEFSYSDTCQNMNVSFTSNAEVNAGGEIIEYYWDFGDYASGITNYATGESAYHIYSSAGDYTVHHVVQNSQGCTDTISRTITILEQPAVDFNFEANCQDQSVSFSINEAVTNIADLALWHWDFGDGGESWEQNPVHVYAAAGEYEVTLYIENTNGCANSVTFEITIANEPSAMFDYTAPTCLGEEIDFVYIPGSGDEYVVAWMWDFGNGVTETVTFPNDPNLSVTYDNEGTYLVTLDVINASGCTNTYSREVIVNPTPIADMSFGQGCEGNTVQFNSLSEENGAGTITTYEWDFGDPGAGVANNSDLENPIHIYDNAGSYDISLTVTSINGCSHTLDSTIVVNVAPEVDFEFASSCLGNATIFNSSDFVNVAEIGDWHWDFGDGTTSNNPDPEHMYVIAETYDVILTVTDINGCSASVSKEVEVLNAPNPTFVFGGDACEGGDMGFDDLSTADDVISQWIWDFGDGTIETIDYPANPDMYHTFVQGGTFIVTLSIVTENGCEASTTQEVIISTAPSAQISYIPACLNSPFEFSGDADLNGGTEVSQWSWDFGDPASGEANFSELQIAEHIYSDPGTYTVALVVSNIDGCADTTFTDVTVGELPEVAMIVSTPVCLGDSVSVDPDVSIVDLGAVDFISWDMGDGNTFIADSVDHIYEHAGIYEISMVLTDTNGCAVSTMSEVEVFAKPVAQFAVNAACEETETQFTDYSYVSNGEQIVEWYWDFDVMNPGVAVSNVQNPVYMYPDLGEYTVKLIVTSEAGCVDSVFMDVEVIKNPLAGFEFDVFTCVEGKVEFTDTTYIFNSSYPVTDWEWEFEEGYFSDEQHPEYIFSETDQTYDVSLTVTDMNGCENTIIIPVYVPKALEIDFDYSETCVGANTYFSDSLVEPLGGNLTHWYWDFGDVASGTNNNSSNADPFHQYSAPGNYVVTLIATDDHYCVDTIMKTIEIFPQPTAQFSYVQPECSNELYFTDESAGVVSQIQRWEWNWGDGSANTVVTSPQTQALAHTYSIDRDYTVTLTVTDANGCMHSFTMDVTKAPCFSAGCTCTPGVICERVEFDLIDQSTPIDKIANWTYDMGDGNIYTFDQNTYTGIISHTYAQHGSYTITVTVDGVVNGSNFVNTFTDWIFVNSTPVPQFRIDNLCSGDEASFIDLSTDSQDVVVGWQWSVATTNFNSTLQNPTYKFATFGEYEAQLISTNSVGCSDSLIKQIQIFAQPEAEFNWDTSCVSKPTFFYDSTFLPDEVNGQNIDSWEWNFGDTTIDWDISNRQDTYWVFSFTGTHPVELVVTDNNGCTDTIHKEIETYKVPYANFSYEASTEVQGEIQLTDLSENALHVIWEYDDMLNIEENPLIKLDDDGVYPIHQIATNEFACSDTMTVVYDMMFKTLFVPNAFNPASGNASIREFRPVGRNIRDYRMRIFDLRGNLLFETTELDEGSPAKGWTGKSNGIDMRPGVYVYMIDAIFKDGTVWNGTCVGDYEHSQRSKTGQFLLIR